MAEFIKGVYKGVVTAQRFKIAKVRGEDVPIFELDFKVLGKVGTDNAVVPVADVSAGTVGLFMTADQLSATKETWADGRPKEKTIDHLRHLGVIGAVSKFSQLDPDTPGYFSLAGKEITLYGKPQEGKPQYAKWNLILNNGGKPKINEKGVATKLDNILRGALGKPTAPAKAPVRETVPPDDVGPSQKASDGNDGLDPDEIPF